MIDALRYDFIKPIEGEPKRRETYYRGHMKHIYSLLKNGKGSIGTLIADPPTTTLQRIKALTTGTLPTFIDAGDNFSPSTEVQEDNFLYQAIVQEKKLTLLGDDTWLSLFPNSFEKSFAYDSFDINELDYVDDSITPQLMKEVENSNSSLIIAHFLGVDHCGHKFGPNHPTMASKLQKMDNIVYDTTKRMKKDDLLIVMGDHGMTSTGDHGGESFDEIYAGIFVYSKQMSMRLPQYPMYQIDIVPTISLLLGLPIPFSNLGTVIKEMFPKSLREAAVAMNYEQIKRFAELYANMNRYIDLHAFSAREVNTVPEQLGAMRSIQSALRIAWTQFNDSNIIAGLLSFLEVILYLLARHKISVEWMVVRSGFVLLQAAVLFDKSNSHTAAHTLLTMAFSVSCISSLFSLIMRSLYMKLSHFRPNPTNIGLISVILYSFVPFSNSYVIYEASVSRYLIQLILISILFSKFREIIPKKNMKLSGYLLIIIKSEEFLAFMKAMVLLRVEPFFHRCREEQVDCWQGYASKPSTALSHDAQIHRLLFSAVYTFCNAYYVLMEKRTNLKDSSRLLRALVYPTVILVLLYTMHVNSGYTDASNRIAQLIYLISFVGFFGCIATKSSSRLKSQFLMFPVYILLGDGLQPAIIVFYHIIIQIQKIADKDTLPSIMNLLVPYGFYLTGHSPVISAIPWTSAFVGIPSSLALRFLPALFILIHLNISSFFVTTLFDSSIDVGISSFVYTTIRILCTSIAASHHRRHLMVWKIFAPKFIFEGVSFISYIVIYWIFTGYNALFVY